MNSFAQALRTDSTHLLALDAGGVVVSAPALKKGLLSRPEDADAPACPVRGKGACRVLLRHCAWHAHVGGRVVHWRNIVRHRGLQVHASQTCPCVGRRTTGHWHGMHLTEPIPPLHLPTTSWGPDRSCAAHTASPAAVPLEDATRLPLSLRSRPPVEPPPSAASARAGVHMGLCWAHGASKGSQCTAARLTMCAEGTDSSSGGAGLW
jgi:hypothetical protein